MKIIILLAALTAIFWFLFAWQPSHFALLLLASSCCHFPWVFLSSEQESKLHLGWCEEDEASLSSWESSESHHDLTDCFSSFDEASFQFQNPHQTNLHESWCCLFTCLSCTVWESSYDWSCVFKSVSYDRHFSDLYLGFLLVERVSAETICLRLQVRFPLS